MTRPLPLLLTLLLLVGACASKDPEVLKENQQLREEVARLRQELAEAKGARPDLARTLFGRVASIDGSKVGISLGGDAGVKIDDIFHLRRGADHVGRITITRVSKATAIGEFDPKYPGPGAPPRIGDAVYLAHG